MTPLFPAPRAAEEFDRVLGGTAPTAVADRYAGLLETVSMLREQPEVVPREAFVADLRSRLMTAAETELVPASVVRRPERAPASRNRRRLGSLAASLVIVGGTAGMAAAASGSMPGESLYPIKRGLEEANTAVHFGDAAKGRTLLEQAETRLDEVSRLQADPTPDTALVTATVESFSESAEAGSGKLFTAYQAESDPTDIKAVRTFATRQMADLTKLSSDQGALDALLVAAADTLADIDQQARVLCDSCSPGEALAPPVALSAGAGAATDLLAGPVGRVQAEISAAQAARVERLKKQIQRNVDRVPSTPAGPQPQSPAPGAPGAPAPETPGSDPLAPKDTPQAPRAGTAVKDLVKGLTGTLDRLTGIILPETPPRDLKKLTDALDKTVKGLTPKSR